MSITAIDWTAAATAATASYDEAVQKATANIIMEVDDLMADPSVGRAVKLAILQQVGAVLASKETIMAFMSGDAAKTPKAVGPGSSDTDDLEDELNAAKARIKQLEDDRKALEEVLHAFTIPALPRMDTPYDGNDLRNRARAKKADIERAAAAAPADFVKKADVKVKLDEVKTAIDAIKTSTMSNKVDGLDTAKTKLGEVDNLVKP